MMDLTIVPDLNISFVSGPDVVTTQEDGYG
jgi:hypothetical protein